MEFEHQQIREIIDVFDKMQEILRGQEIDMPKIVVVGDQSSGKSSVLESITGLSLPRGQNTVTRCPMVIQLKRACTKNEEKAEVWIDEDPVITSCDLEKLSATICEKQTLLIEKEKIEISNTAINVKVYKMNVPDLTLYDLPGITYKNEKVISNIRSIIKKYTAGISTIILLILPSNCDLTTSEALSIIKQQQNYRNRTIAVITKIDLAEKGIFKKISDNELELKYDPIIVRNRTQEEIDNNEEWDKIRTKEMELFNSNEELKKLPAPSKGTNKLIELLVTLQRGILIEASHNIEEQIDEKIFKFEECLHKIPLPVNTLSEKIDKFKTCLRKMINLLNNSMENGITSLENKEFNIQARLREKFDIFNKDFLELKKTFFTKEFCAKIFFRVNESRGLLLQNFLNPKVFSLVILDEIKNGVEKHKSLIKTVNEYMSKIINDFCKQSFDEYPGLLKSINSELNKISITQREKAEKLVKEIIDCELTIAFTSNATYMEHFNNMMAVCTVDKKEGPPKEYKISYSVVKLIQESPYYNSSEESKTWCLNLQLACYSYWTVFENRFLDYLEMVILKKMVYFYIENLEDILDRKFSPGTNQITQQTLAEDASITVKRKQILMSLNAFKEAKQELEKLER